MSIQVWRPSLKVTTPSYAKPKPQKPQAPPKPKPVPVPPPPTPAQKAKAKHRAESQMVKQRADAIYRAVQEGRPLDEIIAQGFEPKWVYRYALKHATKWRKWRQAVACFEAGVSPFDTIGKVKASPTKLAGWYTHYKEHRAKLPAVIPTGCEGIE